MIPLTPRILIVDESDADRAATRELLSRDQSTAWQFVEAQNGEEGLRSCQVMQPDCVLLEYRLPDLTGIEFLSRLKADFDPPTRCAVIMLTDHGNEAIAVQAIKRGADDYLTKSCDNESLIFAMRSAMEKRMLRQQLAQHRVELARLSKSERNAQQKADSAVQAFRESEKRFRTMVNAMPQLGWIARPDGYVFWYNKRWYEYTGMTPAEMEGWGWQRVHDPAVLPVVVERWKACLTTGLPFEMEFPLRRSDGRFQTFLTRIQPLKDREGKVVQWFGTNTDVTDLHASEAIQRALTGGDIGTWHRNVVTGEITWNEQCKRIFGLPVDVTVTYERFLNALHPDDRERTDRAIRASLETGIDYDIEFRSVWPDGSIHWVAAKGRAEFDSHGQATSMQGAAIDITRRKQTEQQIASLNADLERRTRELQEANKDLEAFAYSVSHDLRAPLRAIDGFSKIVLADFGSVIPDEARQYLLDVRTNTQRMGLLVDDLLQFARLGRQAVQPRTVQPKDLVKRCLDELMPTWDDRQIEIQINDLPTCRGDPALLKQVWMNLLSNAIKYTVKRSPARIEIGGRISQEGLEYFVKDNGVGFDVRYSHKLFNVFQRLHRLEEYEGTGVGLAIVKRIIQRHAGRVRAEALPDMGATFSFVLPLEGCPT